MSNKTTPLIAFLLCLTPALALASLPSMTAGKGTQPMLKAQVQDGKATLNASTSTWKPLVRLPNVCQTAAKTTKLPVKAYHARIDHAPVMDLTLCVPQYKATSNTNQNVWLMASYIPAKNRKLAGLTAATSRYVGQSKLKAQLAFHANGQVRHVSFKAVNLQMSFRPNVASFTNAATQPVDVKLDGVARLF